MSIMVRGTSAHNSCLGTLWSNHYFNDCWSSWWKERKEKKKEPWKVLYLQLNVPTQKPHIQLQGGWEVSLLCASERRTSYWWAVQIANTVSNNSVTGLLKICSFIHSFFRSLIKYSLNGCYVQVTILDNGDIKENKTFHPSSLGSQSGKRQVILY